MLGYELRITIRFIINSADWTGQNSPSQCISQCV